LFSEPTTIIRGKQAGVLVVANRVKARYHEQTRKIKRGHNNALQQNATDVIQAALRQITKVGAFFAETQ